MFANLIIKVNISFASDIEFVKAYHLYIVYAENQLQLGCLPHWLFLLNQFLLVRFISSRFPKLTIYPTMLIARKSNLLNRTILGHIILIINNISFLIKRSSQFDFIIVYANQHVHYMANFHAAGIFILEWILTPGRELTFYLVEPIWNIEWCFLVGSFLFLNNFIAKWTLF